MGLHQTHAASDGVGPEEAQERLKVFRSLYVRDRSASILRGSICWLPSFDCSLSSELDQPAFADSNWAARIQLARLQENIYQVFHSADSHRQSSAKHKNALSRIEQSLERWADAHDIFSSACTGKRDVELQLEFLAARISALRGSCKPSHIRQTLHDARASCLLLLISCGKYDQSLVEWLDALPLSKGPPKSLGKSSSPQSDAREGASDSLPLRSHNLLDTFSVPAFFLLVKHVIWPGSAIAESQAQEDINLLQKVCACYKELDASIQANNHIRKVGRAFERLLEVVDVMKNPRQLQTPSDETHQSSNAHHSPRTQNFFDGPQGLADFSDLSSPTASPMLPSLTWDCFSTNNSSMRTSDTASTGAIPSLLTQLNSEFIGQSFDALQQQSFSPHLQQQGALPPSRRRSRWDDPDVLMDYHPE